MKTTSTWLSLLALCMLPMTIRAADHIAVQDAWINEAPPTVTVMAGYARIYNNSDQDMVLIQVTSPGFDLVEIHQNFIKDGMASMAKQETMVINAGSSIEFTPGGLHLMLYQPAAMLKEGDKVKMEFEFSDGTSIDTSAEVRRLQPHHHRHNHDH